VRDTQQRDDLALRLLASERLVAVVPAGHRGVGSGAVQARTLAADPLILFPRSAAAHAFDLYTRPLRDAGVDVEIAQECSNWNSIIAFVAAGLGVTVAPYSVTSLLPPGARRVELEGSASVSRIHMATRPGDDRPLLRAFEAAAASPAPSG
jgi:DNA-binding transcriptional LysR family regulator